MKNASLVKRLIVIPTLAFVCAVSVALSGCNGDIGQFDEDEVSAQACSYMSDKYGGQYRVMNLWEDKSYSLFNYNSLHRVFCEMSDGSTVIVPIGKKAGEPLLDNKQAHEICDEVYDVAIADIVNSGTEDLKAQGYTVNGAFVNRWSPELFDSSAVISQYSWESEVGSEEANGSEIGASTDLPGEAEEDLEEQLVEFETKESPFFHAYYDGNRNAFIEAEKDLVSMSTLDICYEISGPGANYEMGIPVDAPTIPLWETPLDKAGAAFSQLFGDKFFGNLSLYQTGYVTNYGSTGSTLVAEDGSGFLGELKYLGDYHAWLVVDWFYLGHGIWVTSDEHGVRLQEGDVTIQVGEAPSFEELAPERYFASDYPRTFDANALEQYTISLTDEKAAELIAKDEDIAEYGWFSARIAYDNKSPDCGFAQSVTISDLSPSLYVYELEESDDVPVASREWVTPAYAATAYTGSLSDNSEVISAIESGGAGSTGDTGSADDEGNSGGAGSIEPENTEPEESAYAFSGLSKTLMSNGWQYGRLVVSVNEPALYVRF